MFSYRPLWLSFDVHRVTQVAQVVQTVSAVNLFSPGAVAAASGTVVISQQNH